MSQITVQMDNTCTSQSADSDSLIVARGRGERFKEPVTDEDILAITSETNGYAAKTEGKIQWAVKLFEDWKKARNVLAAKIGSNLRPINFDLEDMSHATIDEINYSICRFISEVRRVDGKEYPGDTIRSLVIMMQLHFASKGAPYKLLIDDRFSEIRNALNNVMKSRARAGIGTTKKQADVITINEEKLMWDRGFLGTGDPSTLLTTIFYVVGLNFALRAGEEHRALRHNSQLSLVKLPSGKTVLRYEASGKTHLGGLSDINHKRKSVDAYPNLVDRSKCVVFIYEEYLRHCPKPLHSLPGFYLRPLQKPNGGTWYSTVAVGRHQLSQMVKTLCEKAGIGGYRNNHSIRSTVTTRLQDAHVDEQLVLEVTGNPSVAVRSYERKGDAKRQKISEVQQSGPSHTSTVTSDVPDCHINSEHDINPLSVNPERDSGQESHVETVNPRV